MLSELVIHTEAPDTTVIIANVTTKGIIFSLATANPFTSPDQNAGDCHDEGRGEPIAGRLHVEGSDNGTHRHVGG